MKKALILLVFLLIPINALSQPETSDAAVAKKNGGSGGVVEVTKIPKKAGLEVPAEKLRPQVVPKIGSGIVIDGRPNEEAWANAVVLKDFYQTYPGDNTEPSKPTEVLLMYDDKHLYIAFKCWDEKDKVRATVARRDNVFGEDNVRVWLDTYNDQRRAYVLGFNPLGIQQDGMYTEGSGADFSVDIEMTSKGVIEDWGWSVEVQIPFKSLRYSAGKGKLWGFNAARNIDRFNDEFDQWLPDDRNVSGFLVKHGKITGLDEIKYERTLEVVPSITVSQTGRRTRVFPTTPENPDRFVNNPIKQDIGFTVKYTLSPNITLDAAYNPDFAEIEADAPVVTANQRFPIFFQEKRPFFLEGAEIFSSPLRIFNSRAIIDPDFAAKLTGKIGRTSFGFLAASDKAPGNYSEDERNNDSLQPRISEFLDRNASFAVLRVKRDVGKENQLGFFATYRDFPEQKNVVAAVDGRFKLTPRLTSTFQLAGTHSKRCFFDAVFEPTLNVTQAQRNRELCGTGTFDPIVNQTDPNSLNGLSSTYNRYRTGNGIGYYANLDYTTDRHGFFAEVGGQSTDYRTDAGFTRRTNTNFGFFYNRFSTKSNPKAKIIRASWGQFTGINYDWKGRIQRNNYGTNFELSLPRSTFLFFETGTFFERIYEEEFGLKRTTTRPLGTFFGGPTRSTWVQYASANLNQNYNKQFNYGFFVGMMRNAFDFFYFEPNGMQNPGPGFQFDAQVWFGYRPIDALRFSGTYTKARMVRNDNKIRSFDSDIISVSSTYQFTRFIFTRVRVDYDGTSKNAAGQVLFGWNPTPGKALYVGYNDNFNYSGFNPYTGIREQGFERNSRTFFIRMSYLFRKSM